MSSKHIKKSNRVGEENYNSQGCLMRIVEYVNSSHIKVEFQDKNKTQKISTYANFKKGLINNPHFINVQTINRAGETRYNKQGCLMKIMDYKNAHNIKVIFFEPKEIIVSSTYQQFYNGVLKNPYYPEVQGVGCVGVKYSCSLNGKHTKEYLLWKHMLSRCYGEEDLKKNPTYRNVTVCEEWLNYENFYEWVIAQTNYALWANNTGWDIDKDIIHKHARIYCPENCCLVPHYINSMIIKADSARGKCPVGVHLNKDTNKYLAQCCVQGDVRYLGLYPTPEAAFYVYKEYKEKVIKKTAQEAYLKKEITKECYEGLMRYEVEITD